MFSVDATAKIIPDGATIKKSNLKQTKTTVIKTTWLYTQQKQLSRNAGRHLLINDELNEIKTAIMMRGPEQDFWTC